MRAQRFTTGPHPNGYDHIGVQIGCRVSSCNEALDLAIYTVDGSGHPDTKILDTTYPISQNNSHLTFDTPDTTLLSPNTTYALVVIPEDSVTEISLDTTLSDEEDDDTAEGWSLADTFDIYNDTDSTWSAHDDGRRCSSGCGESRRKGRPASPPTSPPRPWAATRSTWPGPPPWTEARRSPVTKSSPPPTAEPPGATWLPTRSPTLPATPTPA